MQKVTAEEMASMLNGFDADDNFTKSILIMAKRNNLVIVSAIGDDTITFSGALTDEFDLLHGGQIFMARECDECIPYTKNNTDKTRRVIEVFWDKHAVFKWKFLTLIKHSTYDIKRNSKSFCKGIIFSLDDI